MLSYGKSYIDEKTFKNMQIQFSILMKKEAKYIDDCKEILNGMWDGKSELDNNKIPCWNHSIFNWASIFLFKRCGSYDGIL